MKVPRSLSASAVLFAAVLIAAAPLCAQNAVPLDQKAIGDGDALRAAGKYAEALKQFESVPQNYPTSAYIPAAHLGAAICYFYLKDYDNAVKAAEANKNSKAPVAPEILERSFAMIAQIYLAQAQSMKDDDPLRKKTFGDAIKGFEEVIKKFPTSDEAESATYSKGRAQLASGEFDAAVESFRSDVTKFPNNPSLLDSQFMLATALYIKAANAPLLNGAKDPSALPIFEESEKIFRDIVTKNTDVALGNRARFQLGEVLWARSGFMKKETGDQERVLVQALDTYRVVAPKNVVIQAQQQRIKFFEDQRVLALQKADGPNARRYERIVEKEKDKLENINGEPDQSIAAKARSGRIFAALGKFDEARVLLKFALGFVDATDEGKEQKKLLQYLIAVTYAAQHNAEKAVDNYKTFTEAYPKDPEADNLNLLMGGIFLDTDPKINNPDKAIEYFDKQVAEYPNSPFSVEAVMQKANALIQQKKFDQGVAALTQFIATTKNDALLAQAKYNLAIAYMQNGQADQAAATFKDVRDKHKTAPQAEEAGYWLGQILFTKGDHKGALTELDAFIGKNPNSELVPQAYYFKAKALYGLGRKPDALNTYKKISDEYPKSEVAVPAFFERAKSLQDEGKLDEAIAVMRDFIKNFATDPKIYGAYDYIAQIFGGPGKKNPQDAIKTYEEYIAAHPDDSASARAYVAIANLWKREAEGLGTYLSLSVSDQPKWKDEMEKAVANAQTAVEKFPDSDSVSAALQLLLGVKQVQQAVGLLTADQVKAYFVDFARKFEGKSTKSKILFAVAGFIAPKDPGGAANIMGGAYDEKLVYAPEDLDLYGNALVEQKKLDDAEKVFDKLARDYPVPAGTAPEKVGRTVGTAQSFAMAGKARILRNKGQAADGQKILEELKRLYPWSSKVAEAEYGIGAGLFEQKKYEEAVTTLGKVAQNNAAPVHLRAQAMMLTAKALEAQKSYEGAINNYIKIGTFFESEKELASEGLWLGAQLIEKQVTGEIKKPATPTPAPAKPAGAAPKPGEAAPKKA